ncbi:MAG: hypothetical protein AAB956_01080, partial [Patescibacteria group bacterium]
MPIEKISRFPYTEKKPKNTREEKLNTNFLDDPKSLREFMELADEITSEQKAETAAEVNEKDATSKDVSQMNPRQRVEHLRRLKERKADKSSPRSPEEEKNNRERAVAVVKEMLGKPDV